jgi:hypothetical protein
MRAQHTAILQTVEEARGNGRRVGAVLAMLGIKRATYYRWKQGLHRAAGSSRRVLALLPEEQRRIEEVKAAHPEYRHRRIQGVFRQRAAMYLHPQSIYISRSGGRSSRMFDGKPRGSSPATNSDSGISCGAGIGRSSGSGMCDGIWLR